MANTPTLRKTWSGSGDPSNLKYTIEQLESVVDTLDSRTGLINTSGVSSVPNTQATYTLATLPAAATYAGRLIIVSDATPLNSLCVSDGTNWKFVSFGATVS